jgi:hypothetical protein
VTFFIALWLLSQLVNQLPRFRGRLAVVYGHDQLPLPGFHDHGLLIQAADHVEGRMGLAPKGQLKDIFLDALLDDLPKLVLDLEVTIRRA